MDKQLILQRYYSRLIALERRAPLTAATYRFEIRRFLDWLESENLSPFAVEEEKTLKVAGLHDVTNYLARRRLTDGIDTRSVAKAISALRSFYRFLKDDGRSDTAGFATLLEPPRRADRLPEVHQKEDVDRLLSLINTNDTLGIRNRALYELIYSAGLRISEVVSLNLENLFLSKDLAKVTGKGNKERLVIFGPDASYWLRRYIKESRPRLLGKRIGRALFVNRMGKRLSRKGIWKNYTTLAVQAGLSTKLHTLRHTFATELLTGGADLRTVQELLGHAEITTTQIYTHVNQSHLRENHRKFLPTLKNWNGES